MTDQTTQWDFAQDADQVDQSTVETEVESYPTIQFVNGDQRLAALGKHIAYVGGWFIPERNLVEELPKGWIPVELTHQNQTKTAGYAKRDVTVALIRSRRRWEFQNRDKSRGWVPWDMYQQMVDDGFRLSGRTHWLVGVEGLSQAYVLTIGAAHGRKLTNILTDHRKYLLAAANRFAREMLKQKGKPKEVWATFKWPLFAFWLTLGPNRNDKGVPIFEKSGKNEESKMVPLLSAFKQPTGKITPEVVNSLYVGPTLRQQFEVWYNEAEAWAHHWDSLTRQGADKDKVVSWSRDGGLKNDTEEPGEPPEDESAELGDEATASQPDMDTDWNPESLPF